VFRVAYCKANSRPIPLVAPVMMMTELATDQNWECTFELFARGEPHYLNLVAH
jgi:hypothetical protein